MTEFIKDIRNCGSNLSGAILSSVVLYRSSEEVVITVVTDKAFDAEENDRALRAAKKYVPDDLKFKLEIKKLTPDDKMIGKKIMQLISEKYIAVASVISEEDIEVKKTQNGFHFIVRVMRSVGFGSEMIDGIVEGLQKNFCGVFTGEYEISDRSADDLVIEEKHENIEYEIPIRFFKIADFRPIEGSEIPESAVYLSDLNFVSEHVTICGKIDYIEERSYKRANGQERTYFSILLNDTTSTFRVTYFTRQKSIEKIKLLKQGDAIVCTGKTEMYNGAIRFTAIYIDYGDLPARFVPEKRMSKPTPKYYSTVHPQPYVDFTQASLFAESNLPACLTDNDFVVFDLETTGLNSSPAGGNMDRIIEIGAYKIHGGVISESFTTFVNPERKLSDEIVRLTGISDEMVKDAPKWPKVMPDFFKFCSGSYLVGHNIAGFDFKFVDYYCAQAGYDLERKIMDTLPLSQELLFLSNYKLNTVADHFGITFNHHRAIDDALVTAKIFIELIKIKKSLPNLS